MLIGPKIKALHLIGLRPTGDLGPLTGYTSKRGKAVWFLKAPPKIPPTCWQIVQRNAFRINAIAWNALEPQVRANWLNAAKIARLTITGFNLWTWYNLCPDPAVIRTIEHVSGIKLITTA